MTDIPDTTEPSPVDAPENRPETPPVDAPASPPANAPVDTPEPSPTGAAGDAGEGGPTFARLGVRAEVLRALDGLGYEEPTPIQAEAIPPLVAGKDLLGQAATGTGKTAAFALPILERIVPGAPVSPIALVLVPTRELAMQVSEAIYKYGRHLGAEVLPVYGGQPIFHQMRVLNRGVHVVVATPGRAIDHLTRGSLAVDGIELVVLDEADEMLDMGFADDIDAILDLLPRERQTVLFSATMPPRITSIANRHLTDPVRIEIRREVPAEGEAPRVRQVAYLVARSHKAAALGRILDVESPGATLVFCRTRGEVDELTETLNGRGYRAEALHGGMDQEQRDRVMGRLRSQTADLLVATDVAARGLDVDHLTHVVNFDVPSSPESYVHRIGRVGRAGREGVAITLAEPRQRRQLSNIERLIRQPIAVERIPTVADLQARQMELTLDLVRESLEAGDAGELERFQAVVDALADDHDLVEVALAAIRLVHQSSGATDDVEEIPDLAIRGDRAPSKGKGKGRDRDRGQDRGRDGDRDRGDRGRDQGRDRGPRPSRDRGPQGPVARLFVGAGRVDGARPQDLVGAITGESHLHGSDIGAIRIFDRFAIVEVPEADADDVISAMRGTTIRGRKAPVRRDRAQP